MKKTILLVTFLLVGSSSIADEYHYKNMLIGERASGLGGAFAAISDDPSGMYHNPAGIIFSQESYFSLSANAYSDSSQTYKNIAGTGQDYTYRSSSLTPVFFGFTQNIGKNKFGFAVVVPNSDSIDQDDNLTNLFSGVGKTNTLRRRFYRLNVTYLFGPAFATELFNNFTLGLSVFGFYRNDKIIDNQLLVFNPNALAVDRYFIQNGQSNIMAYGLLPKFGIQYMPIPKWSLGLTLSLPYNLGGSGSYRILSFKDSATENPPIVVLNGSYLNDIAVTESSNVSYKIPENPSINFGTAYFFSKATMLTGQVDYHFAYKRNDGYQMQSVMNLSLGAEYYPTESYAIRTGFFTDNSMTSSVVDGGKDQLPHVNRLGGTLSFTLSRPGSSLTLGGAYALGSGRGQAIGGSTEIQDVQEKNLSIYLTGSYQM